MSSQRSLSSGKFWTIWKLPGFSSGARILASFLYLWGVRLGLVGRDFGLSPLGRRAFRTSSQFCLRTAVYLDLRSSQPQESSAQHRLTSKRSLKLQEECMSSLGQSKKPGRQ